MSDEILAEGRFLRLRKRDRWEYAERTGDGRAVVIVAMTEHGKVLLIEQHRPPIGRACVEMPAGLVGDDVDFAGEAMEAAAERELLEETGYAAEQMELVAMGPPSPGAMNETVAFFRASGLRKVARGGGVDSENITIREVPLNDVPQFLRDAEDRGLAVDPKVFAGLYFLGGATLTPSAVSIRIPSTPQPKRHESGVGMSPEDSLFRELDHLLPPLPASGRVGILGGTFNPPHVGHALLAHAMLSTEELDEIWVIPVFEHPFGKASADFDDRVAMCRLAFAHLGSAVRVVEIERELPKPSYTVQTLSALHALRPGIEPTLVIGSDIVPDLPRWQDPERLPHLSRIIVVPRQGAPRLEPPENLDVKVYRGFRLPKVSSTAIKKALGGGEPVDGWLDHSVFRYIEDNLLYR